MSLLALESQMNLQQVRNNFSIDLMDWNHLDQVLRLERESFSTPWPRISFVLSLNHPEVDALVMEDEGNVAAYLIASDRDGEYLIANIAVAGPYRRRGLAKALISKALELADKRGATHAALEVRESNQAAIRLYEAMGFRIVRKNPGYYSSPPEDALVMICRLPAMLNHTDSS